MVDDVNTADVIVVLEIADVVDDVAGSTHVDADVAAGAVLYFPAGHSWHAADPTTALNLPALHSVHGPPSGPENPMGHGAQLEPSPAQTPQASLIFPLFGIPSQPAQLELSPSHTPQTSLILPLFHTPSHPSHLPFRHAMIVLPARRVFGAEHARTSTVWLTYTTRSTSTCFSTV